MESNLGDLHWFKSSFSAAGNCVEVAHLPGGGVAVRDSKDRAKAAHVYNRTEWEAFLAGAKNGEFDPAARDLPARGERKTVGPASRGTHRFFVTPVPRRTAPHSSSRVSSCRMISSRIRGVSLGSCATMDSRSMASR